MKSAQLLKGAATLSLLLALPPRLHAQTPTGLSALNGNWTLNREKSDNPQEKLSAAMQGRSDPNLGKVPVVPMGRLIARSGGARPADMAGSPSSQNDQRGIYRNATQEIVFAGEAVHIGATDEAVVIQYATRPVLSVKANGKRENFERFGAAEALTKADWKKDKLTIETEANDGLTTKEEYEVTEKNGAKQLQVSAQMRLTNGEIVRVKRVYDAKPTGS